MPQHEIPEPIDVAFSLLAQDEPLARELSGLIGDRLRLFLFSERQKELAFKNGAAAFTEVYESRAQFVVVLYRAGWGTTKWTRLEESAITSRGVNLGWQTVWLISLDRTKPLWLPEARLFYGIEEFGVQTAAEAIVGRFGEMGGTPHPESTIDFALRKARLAAAQEFRDRDAGSICRRENVLTLARQHSEAQQKRPRPTPVSWHCPAPMIDAT